MKSMQGKIFFGIALVCGVILWCVPQTRLSAATRSGYEDCARFEPGFAAFKKGRYVEAGETWDGLRAGPPDKRGPIEDLRPAGMAKVLASIAFERAGDPRMFQCWDQAQVHFREAGTTWETERREFSERLSAIRAVGKTLKSGAGQGAMKGGELVCLDMEKELSVSTYEGPSKAVHDRPGTGETAAPAGIRYFARPFLHGTGGDGPSPGGTSDGSGTRSGAVSDRDLREDGGPHRSKSAVPRKTVTLDGAGKSGEPTAAERPFGFSMSRSVPFSSAGLDNLRTIPGEFVGSGSGTGASGEKMADFNLAEKKRTPLKPDAGDMEIARVAWKYFVRNYQAESGMVNPVSGYVYGTFWDVASTLAGFVAAEKLGLISRTEFDDKTGRLLESLLSMPMYKNELPNREYDLRRLAMVDLGNHASHIGSGWSAIDLGRLLIWLRIVRDWYPDLRQTVEQVVDRWKFDRSCSNMQLNCALHDGRREQILQEGRVGYEQYAASGYGLWGRNVDAAFDYGSVKWIDLHGEKIPVDSRSTPFLTSEPFFLARMELGGLGKKFSGIIDSIYRVQKKRWEATGSPTAVSEDTMDRVPWFVYNCIYYEGAPWTCVSHKGKPFPELKSLSTKAALAWAAIYDDSHARELRSRTVSFLQSDAGYYAGRYDTGKAAINRSLNVNTNAVILETMLYLHRGREPFLRFSPPAE